MQESSSPRAFNTPASLRLSKLLPVRTCLNGHPVTCNNCGYINNPSNNYCTNCGYPSKPNGDSMALYKYRLFKRKQFLKACDTAIVQARGTLYFMSGICLLGIVYLLSGDRTNILRSTVLFIVAAIFFVLGRWSRRSAFTPLLISFLMLVTFMAINTWAELDRMFTTATGVYLLLVQLVLFYFLFKGVKAAYQADILEDEFTI